jgi:hypothetical protein
MKGTILLTRDNGKSFVAKPVKAKLVFSPSTNKLSVKCKLWPKKVKIAAPEYCSITPDGYMIFFNPETMEQTTFNHEYDRELFDKVVEANELLKATKYNTQQFTGSKPQDHITLGFAALLIVGLALALMIYLDTSALYSPATLQAQQGIASSMQSAASAQAQTAIVYHQSINELTNSTQRLQTLLAQLNKTT